MEFLVTMTTHVPEGTSDAAVDEVRGREAARSLRLATEGHLTRLWRPPLKPGEWRTLGLFVASDQAALAAVLLSMPLRVWRTDEAVPLLPHPNDPGGRQEIAGTATAAKPGSEFFTTFSVTAPAGTARRVVDDTHAREAERARELARAGSLLRLWTLPGNGRALGLWRAESEKAMETILDSLPQHAWTQVETVRLTPHPSDPGAPKTAGAR